MEESTKTKRPKIKLRKIILNTVLVASALVYIIFFIRFFNTCEVKIADDFYLDKETAKLFSNLDIDLPFYHYQPKSYTGAEGYVQITNIHYLEKTGDLQMTVRYRDKIFENENGDYPFEYKIRVEGAEESSALQTPVVITQEHTGYTHSRLCAKNVVSDHGEKVTVSTEVFDEQGNSTEKIDTEIKGGTQVYLDIYDKESGERLFVFEVAGKNVNRARIRRSTVDVVVTE